MLTGQGGWPLVNRTVDGSPDREHEDGEKKTYGMACGRHPCFGSLVD
jgi:hypothetical protein